jgi:hypothetical protein
MTTNINPEDEGSRASETSVSNHPTTRHKHPEIPDFYSQPWKPRIMHNDEDSNEVVGIDLICFENVILSFAWTDLGSQWTRWSSGFNPMTSRSTCNANQLCQTTEFPNLPLS